MLSMSPTERDKFQGDMANPKVGIPINDNKNYEGNYNDFQVWLKAIYNVAQRINKEQGDAAVTPEERANLQNLYTALMRKVKVSPSRLTKTLRSLPFSVCLTTFRQ